MSDLNVEKSYLDQSWYNSIIDQINVRESKQQTYKELYQSCSKLSDALVKERNHSKKLERDLAMLASRGHYHTNHQVESKDKDRNQLDSIEFYQKRIEGLELQVSILKEERGELYKNQGVNAQRLLDMTDKVAKFEASQQAVSLELTTTKAKLKKSTDKYDLSIEVIREKDKAIQILQDELTTSHLELTKIEERNKQLKQENTSLLQRWLKKMNEEAESMNLSNMLSGTFSDWAGKGTKLLNQAFTSPTQSQIINTIDEKPPVNIPDNVGYSLQPHSGEINCIQSSNQGTMFATASSDRSINIYQSTTGKIIHTFKESSQSYMYVEFNPTDELCMGACNDNTIRIFNLRTNKLKEALTGHIGKIYSAKFTQDGTKVVSGSHDRTLKVWDLHRSICTRTMFTFSSCNDACWLDGDGTSIASGHLDHTLRLWDTRSGNCIREVTNQHEGQITSVTLSPDGTKLLSNCRDNILRQFDLRTYQLVNKMEAEGFKVPMNWSKCIYSPDGKFVTAGSADGGIYHFDANTGQLEISHTLHRFPICSISWNPQSYQLLSVDKERIINVWGNNLPSH